MLEIILIKIEKKLIVGYLKLFTLERQYLFRGTEGDVWQSFLLLSGYTCLLVLEFPRTVLFV